VTAFYDYAEFCFQNFGSNVTRWLTFNEPLLIAWLGNGLGVHAPGRCSNRSFCEEGNSTTEPYLVAHNLLRAHAQVADLYHRNYQKAQKGKIGITLNSDWAAPLTIGLQDDLNAAMRYMDFMLGWFADPIYTGDYPGSMRNSVSFLPHFTPQEVALLRTSNDFFGLNHYTSLYTTHYLGSTPPNLVGWEKDLNINTTRYRNGRIIGDPSDSSWLYVVPYGFRSLLKWIKDNYNNPEIIVTENGVSVPGESQLPLSQARNDTFRINYFSLYLAQLEAAISQDQVNVKGYFAWTLLDNFEWGDGYAVRFGLHYVDFNTPQLLRYPKASAAWYNQYILSQKPEPIPLDAKWWFVTFLLFPGFVVLLLVGFCVIYEYRNHSSEYKPLLGDNSS